MCGYIGPVHKAIVEGTMLGVCGKCLKYGDAVEVKKPSTQVVEQRLAFQRNNRYKRLPSVEENVIVSDYARRVKRAREKLGKKQEEIAQSLAERTSVIHRVESGSMEPPMKLAKKLEQFFSITLVEKSKKVKAETVKEFDVKTSGVTIGDLIKLKKG
jgi:putative transcription factor